MVNVVSVARTAGRPARSRWGGFEVDDRVAVLLGAGASKDAGLPLTHELAQRIVGSLNERTSYGPVVQALNFVYGAMVGYQGETGANPLQAVNIERLVSAVRLLARRADHEVAPFVSSWRGTAVTRDFRLVGQRHGSSLRSAVGRAIGDRSFGGDELGVEIARIAAEIAGDVGTQVFRSLEVALLERIAEELGEFGSVDYLLPLAALARAQSGGLDIITLNYDTTVESMCKKAGIEVDTGFARWTPGTRLEFGRATEKVNLFKIHGSLGWRLKTGDASGLITSPSIEPIAIKDGGGNPWIVVGDREKLDNDGPILPLLEAAREALAEADHLCVIGYSFSDRHVNTLVRDWMQTGERRTLGVLDIAWPTWGRIGDPRLALADGYGQHSRRGAVGTAPRVEVIEAAAKSGLEQCLAARPRALSDPVSVALSRAGRRLRISLTVSDDRVISVRVSDGRERGTAFGIFERVADRDATLKRGGSGPSTRFAEIRATTAVHSIVVYSAVTQEDVPLALRVESRSHVAECVQIVTLPLPSTGRR